LLAAELEPDVEKYVTYDQAMKRPAEVDMLIGDASKAKRELNWEPTTSFEELVSLMVKNDLKIESSRAT
jgi:GDPmannose 4,6-dehydratase